jgi:hypothetical protein
VSQRHRWTYGGFQVLGKYRDTMFTRRMDRLSLLGLPYFLIFPWVDVLVSLMFVTTVTVSIATGSLLTFMGYFAAMSAVTLAMNLYALHIAQEDKRLALWAILQPMFYAHVLTFVTARAGVQYLLRREARWDKLQRLGANTIPSTVHAGTGRTDVSLAA